MRAPSTHTTPSGSSFRISLIQALREQSLFLGQSYAFHVERDSGEPGSETLAFDVKVTISPIAIAIAAPEDRLRARGYAEGLVKRSLDEGNLQDVEIAITSDGAVTVGDRTVERVFPLATA